MESDSSLERSSSQSPTHSTAARCPYCGAPLNPFFYFCVVCATPYKDVESVTLAAAPPVMGEGQLIERKAPAAWPLFWTYLGVVLGGAMFSFALFREDRPDLQLLLMDVLIFVTTCIFAMIYWPTLKSQLRVFGFTQWPAVVGLAALVPLLLFNFVQYRILTEALDVEDVLILSQLRQLGWGEAMLIFTFCVLPAVTEEIAFRGLLQQWLQVAIKPWRALVLASALFAAMHLSLLTLPYLFAVGMLLGWVKWRTRSLYPSILIHFLHNLVVIELFPAVG